MENLWVESEGKRGARNLILLNGALFLCALAILIGMGQELVQFLSGCKNTSLSEIAASQTVSELQTPYVHVSTNQGFPSGYQNIETQTDTATNKVQSTTPTADYRILQDGDKFLIVKTKLNSTVNTYSGLLTYLPSDLKAGIQSDAEITQEQFNAHFAPFLLDSTDYWQEPVTALAILLPILLFTAWNCWRGYKRFKSVQQTAVWKNLALFGDPAQLSITIDQQLRSDYQRYGKVLLTQDWWISKNSFSTIAWPADDTTWVYTKVTRHSVNFIPTGKTYAIIVHSRYGHLIELSCKKKMLDDVVGKIQNRVPWAVYGYNDERNDIWKKHRNEFVAVIDENRQRFM